MELLRAQAAELNHLLHRHALLPRWAALARRAQLLDLGQEALDGDFKAVRVELGLGGAEPAREDDAERRAVGGPKLDAELVRKDARADEGLDDAQVVVPLRTYTRV